MIELCNMIPELVTTGHRVLIFSQSRRMLDIIQPILAYQQCRYVRMDGTTRAMDRQEAIDRFNAPNSLDSVALICTKGLGVGTN
jgi:SNF2 family DNA or RNA helicase